MINLEMGTDEVVIKVEFINFYRFYIAEMVIYSQMAMIVLPIVLV